MSGCGPSAIVAAARDAAAAVEEFGLIDDDRVAAPLARLADVMAPLGFSPQDTEDGLPGALTLLSACEAWFRQFGQSLPISSEWDELAGRLRAFLEDFGYEVEEVDRG